MLISCSMHNLIEDIICNFTPEEVREFKYFLGGNNNIKNDREDIKLVDAIRNEKTEEYANSNAYHQTRKRLKKQLELFVQNLNVKQDPVSEIINMMEVARFFFRKNLHGQAWHYLNMAEEMARDADDYKLLDFIHDTQIGFTSATWADSAPLVSVPELLYKRDTNLEFAHKDAGANAAFILMLHEIRNLFAKEVYANIDDVMDAALEKYKLNDKLLEAPKIYCKIVNMVCRAIREKKDYETLKKYALANYQLLKRRKMLDKIPQEFVMDLTRSVYLASIRTGDFKKADVFQKLYDQNKEHFRANPEKYIFFDFRSGIMAADLLMFTGKLKEAENLFSTLLRKYSFEIRNTIIYFLLRINLLALYFKLEDYEKCISIYSGLIQQYQKQVLKEEGLGMEMLLFTEIYGIIFYYEINDMEYALHLINRIKRKYAATLKEESLYREALFLKIIERMVKGNMPAARLEKEGTYFLSLKKYIRGDKEYISLNAWLESKITGQSYYHCFMNPGR